MRLRAGAARAAPRHTVLIPRATRPSGCASHAFTAPAVKGVIYARSHGSRLLARPNRRSRTCRKGPRDAWRRACAAVRATRPALTCRPSRRCSGGSALGDGKEAAVGLADLDNAGDRQVWGGIARGDAIFVEVLRDVAEADDVGGATTVVGVGLGPLAFADRNLLDWLPRRSAGRGRHWPGLR